jgi:hypothetical protein
MQKNVKVLKLQNMGPEKRHIWGVRAALEPLNRPCSVTLSKRARAPQIRCMQ